MQRSALLQKLKQDGMQLEHVNQEQKEDKELVLAAVSQDGLALKFAGNDLTTDRDVVRAAASQNIMTLEFASDELLTDKTFMMFMISINPFALQYAHASLQADKDVVRAAASQIIMTLEFASDELLTDKAFIMELISITGEHTEILGFASAELLADKAFIMEQISINPFALAYANEPIKADKEVIRAAVNIDIETLKFASDELLADKDFIMEMISIDPFALQYAHESLQANKKFRLEAVMHDARAITYLVPILNKETNCKEEEITLLAVALASPNQEKLAIKTHHREKRECKLLLTMALSLAIKSNTPCRLSRFLKQYGHEAAYLYHNTLGVAEKDSSESAPWTGHHAALLHAIDTDKLSLINETLLQEIPWPQKTVAPNDPFLFALWNAVQSIDHIEHPNLYFTLYFQIMDCLSADTEDVLHLESALERTLRTIVRLKMYVSYLLSDELLKTLETIYDDANMYQRHLTISTDKQGEQAATIVPWRYKPINDLLTKVIEAYQGFHGRYKRITRKQSVESNAPCTADDLQKIEYELIHLQSCIRGKDHGIFNAICCTINPYRDQLSSQSFFANGTSSAIASPGETISESTQSPAKRQKTSSFIKHAEIGLHCC